MASLRSQLDLQTREHNLDSTGRVVWLLDQLENYLERWLGILSAQTEDPKNDELFQMVELATETIGLEIQGLPSNSVKENWQHFLGVLAEVRRERIQHSLGPLTQALRVVRSAAMENG